ncbi:MAG: 16S rRNA (adenine(1518)-N(6)/adenine(1519)-N(6))-dimethyltransferase RsmA [Burkholderiales bacterium]|nr:MAG: 16S rRNA (adenine(1518)-N(6)/adenine(1519)-N(6))-dimethyltransferase RsmA [Burkholderiales bacterium]
MPRPVAGHVPRKRFGQHFLVDPAVIDAIVDAIDPRPTDRLVEIGPGLGALTAALLERIDVLEAVELDRDLVDVLGRRFGDRLVLHPADALAFDFGRLAADSPLRLVGNLPYNISTPLLIRLVGLRSRLVDAHFMLQKEVVDRVAAAPGGRDYGRLSVMMQAYFQAQALFEVAPHAFEPPPRVHSAVLRLRPLAQPATVSAEALERVVAAAFAQRRKMLRTTLLPWLAGRGVDREIWQALGIAPTARAEELPVATYVALARHESGEAR